MLRICFLKTLLCIFHIDYYFRKYITVKVKKLVLSALYI